MTRLGIARGKSADAWVLAGVLSVVAHYVVLPLGPSYR